MTENTQDWVLANGLDVIGSDDEKIGEVQDALGEYFVVKKGWLFSTEYYVPSAAIVNVDDRAVYLNVTKDEALNQGWDQLPASVASVDTRDQRLVAGDADFASQPLASGDAAYDAQQAPVAGSTATDDTIRVPLSQEELSATRRGVDRGSVQVEKRVVEDEQSLDVPVTEERVHVERRTVDRDAAPGETLFQEGTIDIPVRGEEVDVQKRAHVTEELEVSKDAVQRTEHVTDTVRREEAHVTGDDDLADDETARPVR
jgi:uncharacterized protein (TIGR02271 family)